MGGFDVITGDGRPNLMGDDPGSGPEILIGLVDDLGPL